MKYTLLASWLLALVGGGAVTAADHTAECTNQPSAALALLNEGLPARLEFDVMIGGTSLVEVWNTTFDALFRFADADADGELKEGELVLLPSAQALRLALGSGFAPPVGTPVSLKDLRRDANGRITAHELAEYYRQRRAGTVSIGVGQLKSAPALTRALLGALDSDHDGSVSNPEWASAAETLTRLDTNDDELVGAGEIVPNLFYPGSAGTMLLKSTNKSDSTLTESSLVPVVLLSDDPSGERWKKELVNRGIHLNADQWLSENAAARWSIQFGVSDAATSSFAWSSKKLRWQGWSVVGSLGEPNRLVREHVLSALDATPSDSESSSANGQPSLDWLVPLADRDRNGKVSHVEAEQWCNVQSSVIRGQVLVAILWGGGLFEILDSNHDGALSTRELRSAWQAISEAGCVADGRFDVAEVPQVILAVASQGYPQTITEVRPGGPNWARAMDRNADGDISRKEFSGPVEAFRRMDLDRDGLVDPEEAAMQLKPGR